MGQRNLLPLSFPRVRAGRCLGPGMNDGWLCLQMLRPPPYIRPDRVLVILEVQEFNKNWENIWFKGLILALLDILDREDRELRGEGQESGESSTQAEADGDMEQEGTELTEDDGQQEMEAA